MTKKKKRKSTKKKAAGDKLNPLQQKFGKLYASEREVFANGVQAYVKAFALPWPFIFLARNFARVRRLRPIFHFSAELFSDTRLRPSIKRSCIGIL